MIRLAIIFLILFNLSACSLIKHEQPESLSFLPNYSELTEQRERAPFKGYWMNSEEMLGDLKSFKLHIQAVDYQAYREHLIAEEFTEEEVVDLIDEAQELSKYFKNKLILSLVAYRKANPEVRPAVILVDDSQSADYSLALSFVKIKPANPTVNILGTILGFLVPGGGAVKLTVSSYVSIAGFLQAAPIDQSIIFQFYDREGQKFYPFTFKDFQRYAHTRVAIDDWSEQLVELLHTSSDQKVADGSLIGIDLF